MISQAVLVGALFRWWVAAALVLSAWLTERRYTRRLVGEIDAWQGQTEGQRRARYVFELGTDEGAKELRVFGLSGWLVQRYLDEWTTAIRPVWRARWRGAVGGLFPLGAYLIVFAAAIALVGAEALRGEVSVSQAATVIPAILTLAAASAPSTALQVQRGVAAYRAMEKVPQLPRTTSPSAGSTSTTTSRRRWRRLDGQAFRSWSKVCRRAGSPYWTRLGWMVRTFPVASGSG
jgi:hypothetical protein